jgi:uncharacterized protein (TIGR02678 family)
MTEAPVDLQLQHERRRAVRALLMSPLLKARGKQAETFGLVRVHAPWLRDWFGKQVGWSLYVDSEIARLGKIPAEPVDSTRPAREPEQGTAFNRTRYVLFCLALACLERGERQTTLGSLATELGRAVAEEPVFERSGIGFDLTSRESRKDLVHVIRLLIDLGVMIRVHGEESQYLAERGDVLYTIHRQAISVILNVRRGPSSIQADDLEGRISALLEEARPDTEEGWNRHVRMQLTRRLIDDPVLYYEGLDPGWKSYLDSQRSSLLRNIEEGTGLLGEVRAEGIALVDETGELTDLGLPEEGTEGHFSILLADFLARRFQELPSVPVGVPELEKTALDFVIRFSRYWRKDARIAGAEKILLADAVERLEALRLVEVLSGGAVRPLAALARYAVDPAQLSLSEEKPEELL